MGDPLLVKVGGAMVPSPFAQQLVEDLRPILRSIQRVAAPPQHFDPATSERTFRVAVSDFTPSVMPEVGARVRKEVPDLLARTDMLATLPLLLPEALLAKQNLCVVEAPLPIAAVPLSYFWSFRSTNDPGGRWLRAIVTETFATCTGARHRRREPAVDERLASP